MAFYSDLTNCISKNKSKDFADVNFICNFKPEHCEKINFLAYLPPPSETRNDLVEEWVEMTSLIEQDLMYLLSLPHYKFWSQVIFDESLHSSLTSFLRLAPRSYERKVPSHDQFAPRINSLVRLYFLVCLRMSTHKEDKNNQIPTNQFGDILYENFVFEVPMIMDICTVYGKSNESLVEKMIKNIFTVQPKYLEDLKVVVETLPSLFRSVCDQCGIQYDDDHSDGSAHRLKKLSQSILRKDILTIPRLDFEDIVLYLLDVSFTLMSFLNTYPPACEIFFVDSFLIKLGSFYEKVTSCICEAFVERGWSEGGDVEYLEHYFAQSRYYFLQVFRTVLYHSTLNRLFEKMDDNSDCGEIVERYLSIVTSLLTERHFLADYFHLFPLCEDRELMEQTSYKVDDMRFRYITDVVSEATLAYHQQPSIHSSTLNATNQRENSDKKEQNSLDDKRKNDLVDVKRNFVGDVKRNVDDIKKNVVDIKRNVVDIKRNVDDSHLGACGGVEVHHKPTPTTSTIMTDDLLCKISSIHEMLPHLGPGFVMQCLLHFQSDVEKTLNALLEDQLPPNLKELDQYLQLENPDDANSAVESGGAGVTDHSIDHSKFKEDVSVELTGSSLLSQRRNVYDGDEFDIFNRPADVDDSKIHIGKRNVNDPSSTDDSQLNDKSTISNLKSLYYLYGNEFTEGSYYDKVDNDDYKYEGDDDGTDVRKGRGYRCKVYDDEYDDTYDSHEHGEFDTDSVDELSTVKPFVKQPLNQPLSNLKTGHNDGDDGDENGGDDGDDQSRKSFLEDPAKLRELAAQRRAQKFANKSFNRRNNHGGGFQQQQQQQQSYNNYNKQQTYDRQHEQKHQQPQQRQNTNQQPQHQQSNNSTTHSTTTTTNTTTSSSSTNASTASNNNDSNFHPNYSRDVKGGPKGQGQSEDVLRNRNYKERNKSTRVHHNRKDAAERKHRAF